MLKGHSKDKLGVGAKARLHAYCVMTTVALTHRQVKKTRGWWAMSQMDQTLKQKSGTDDQNDF